MNDERLLDVERWIAWVRLAAVLFAAVEVGIFTERFPSGYERLAWALTGGVRARRGAALRREPARPQSVAAPRRGRARVRHGRDQRLCAPLLVRVRKPDAVGAHLPGRGGGASLRPARWRHRAALPAADARLPRVVARGPLRPAGVQLGPCDLPVRDPAADRLDRRLARCPAPTGGGRRNGVRRPRPSSCATGSGGASTCSRRRAAARGRSAPRSTSTRPSAHSSASSAGSCRSTGRRSSSRKEASRT